MRPVSQFLIALSLLILSPLSACDTPVFRYALERWHPDPHDIIVFHNGPLAPEVNDPLQEIIQKSMDAQSGWYVREIDVKEKLDPSLSKLWKEYRSLKLPALVIRRGDVQGNYETIWKGDFNLETLQNALNSPARNEIANRLLNADSAVWILIEGGDPIKNSSLRQNIQEVIDKMQETLEIPEPSPDTPPTLTSIPLKVAFSILPINRSDPKEQFFIQMLLRSEKDLAKSTEPILFVTFGRGRCIFSTTGKSYKPEIIEEACTFLTGPCSCEIKHQNPGHDILFGVNWEALLEQEDQRLMALAQKKIEEEDARQVAEEKAAHTRKLVQNATLAIIVAAAILGLFAFVRNKN